MHTKSPSTVIFSDYDQLKHHGYEKHHPNHINRTFTKDILLHIYIYIPNSYTQATSSQYSLHTTTSSQYTLKIVQPSQNDVFTINLSNTVQNAHTTHQTHTTTSSHAVSPFTYNSPNTQCCQNSSPFTRISFTIPTKTSSQFTLHKQFKFRVMNSNLKRMEIPLPSTSSIFTVDAYY